MHNSGLAFNMILQKIRYTPRKRGKTENGFEADETSWSSKLRQSDTLKTSKRRLLQPSPTFRPNFEHPTFRFEVKRSQTEVTL